MRFGTGVKAAFAGFLLQAAASAAVSSFSPTSIVQSIELSGALTRYSTSYVLAHTAESGATGTRWTVGVKGHRVGFVEAAVGESGGKKSKVAVTKVDHVKLSDDGVPITYYTLTLPSSTSSSNLIVTISSVASHEAEPRPASLPQRADSLLLISNIDLSASLDGLSADERVTVKDVKIKVKAPSPRIGEVRAPKSGAWDMSHTKGGATITFTSKASVSEMVGEQIATVHYAQPEAMASIRTLDRVVEVSHWGAALAVQDTLDLSNVGPLLEGQFSRLDHQRLLISRRASPLTISSLSMPLPANVHSTYFYDTVGNVSTSRFRPSPKHASSASSLLPSQRKKLGGQSLLELQPRYPIMGGWNYSFTIDYDQPLGDVLRQRKGANYVLAVPFLTPIKDTPVDRARVEIRLPEGARDIRVLPPFPVDSLTTDGPLAKTYLDVRGRPTIVLEKRDCSDRCGQDVLIEYSLPLSVDLLQKPLAIAALGFVLFVVLSFARRSDWSIPSGGSAAVVGKGEKAL